MTNNGQGKNKRSQRFFGKGAGKCFFIKKVFPLIFSFLIAGCAGRAYEPLAVPAPEPDHALELTVFAYDGASDKFPFVPNFGHAFASVKNLSAEPAVFYGYTLESGEEATFGTWVQTAGGGIWFNLEAQYIHNYGRYGGVVSVSRMLPPSGIAAVEDYMRRKGEWLFTYNCSAFVAGLWNAAAGADERMDEYKLSSPARLKRQIERFESRETDRQLAPFLPSSRTGHFDKKGAFHEFR